MKRVAKPSAEIVVGLSQNHQCLYYIYLCKKVIWPDPRFIFNAFTCTYILKYMFPGVCKSWICLLIGGDTTQTCSFVIENINVYRTSHPFV